jgi:hypothetical protein
VTPGGNHYLMGNHYPVFTTLSDCAAPLPSWWWHAFDPISAEGCSWRIFYAVYKGDGEGFIAGADPNHLVIAARIAITSRKLSKPSLLQSG